MDKLPPRHPSWNLWQGLFLILLVNLVELPMGWLKASENLDTLDGFLHFLAVGLGEGLLYLGAILVLMRLLRQPLKGLGLVKPRLGFWILGIIVGIFLFVSIGLLGNLLIKFLGTPAPQSFTEAVKGVKYGWQFLLLILLGGVIAPLKEEMIFRGLIYPPLRQAYGRGRGMLLTGVFFAALHFDLVRFLPLFIGGVILTWVYERSGSLWPAVLAHGTWNVLMALALWVQR
ncbi:CPBP family intramembrane glutamic endopeptidase [Paradesulfitobacterium ferrireducens]|uniref:CPBP family intramembrane glutamic endopeptidase n=1 Tax=Paradesulfitobacterium ferrireducens TaxID=2816476 RepID=UPI001A8FF710|nr:type II CAAX endopeptidase family protein [Paradesulfitobacterium ferrireducens]